MTLKGEIYVLANGLNKIKKRFDWPAFFSDINSGIISINLQMVYTSLPIPDGFFFPSGDRYSQISEEEWEKDFIKWAKKKYGVHTALKLDSEKVDLEGRIESPGIISSILSGARSGEITKFDKRSQKIADSLPLGQIYWTDKHGWSSDLERGHIGDRLYYIGKKTEEVFGKLHYPSPMVRTLLCLLNKKFPAKKVAVSYLVERYGFQKSKFKLSEEYGTAFPVITKGNIPEEFPPNACKLYAIDTGLGHIRGFCTIDGYTDIFHKIKIYAKGSKGELELPEVFLDRDVWSEETLWKDKPPLINVVKCIKTLRLLTKYACV